MKFRDVARLAVLVLVVLIWMMPAASAFELNGTWNFAFETEDGPRTEPMVLKLDGDQVGGTFLKSNVKGTFSDGKLALKFPHYSAEGGYEAEVTIKGAVDGDSLKGDWSFGEHDGTFTATRAK